MDIKEPGCCGCQIDPIVILDPIDESDRDRIQDFTMDQLQNNSNFQTLQGKVAIVTGASRGLGLGFALELARRGAKVS